MAEVILQKTYISDLSASIDIPDIKKLAGASVLATGSTGLIGSCFVDMLLYLNHFHGFGISVSLAGRNESKALSRFSEWDDKRIGFELFDANRPSPFKGGYDYVVHCASNAHPAIYVSEPAKTVMANVLGTEALLRQCVNDSSSFLYVSSSEVYGRKATDGLYGEDEFFSVDLLDPRSCYPCSKRTAENLCACFQAEYGVNYSIARPGHVYGPTMTESDSRAHAQFARSAAAGEPIVMKSLGNQLRSYCYVCDCASALLTILICGESGWAYNISNRDSVVTIRQMAEAFAKAGNVALVMDVPTAEEAAGYNRMSCSALNAERLEQLGWRGLTDMLSGAIKTVEHLRSAQG